MNRKRNSINTGSWVWVLAVILSLGLSSCTRNTETVLIEPTQRIEADQTGSPEPAHCRFLDLEETNSQLNNWLEPHYVCSPAEDQGETSTLFLFLPGTGATPDYYTVLSETAADAGLHVINLRYPNDKSVNLQLCPLDQDQDCHQKLREEIVRGGDFSPHVDVNPENSIEGRLISSLRYLHQTYPDQGWDLYLDSDGSPVWSSIIVSGHSQGAGHAIFLGSSYDVQRVIAFAGVDVRRGELAPWLMSEESASPPEDYYLFYHEDDDRVARYQEALADALEIDAFGDPVIVDAADPPYDGSHVLVAVSDPPEGGRAHNVHVADKALTFDESGDPLYLDAWLYLLIGEQSYPETGLPYQTAGPKTATAEEIGLPSVRYIDPEFYSAKNLVAFADGQRRGWLGTLDPWTGDFLSLDGRDTLIDEDLTRLASSFNGPEFGLDQDGWSLYYTKDVEGVPQVWRAEPQEGGLITGPVTEDDITRLSVLASKDPTMGETRLLYALNGFAPGVGEVAWMAESNPAGTETAVAPIDRGARWVDGTSLFTYVLHSGRNESQVVLHNTDSGAAAVITDTPGQKSYAYGWLAPVDGRLQVLSVIDGVRIEVYQDSGGDYWDRVRVLEIPESADYSLIGSPEPFTAGGKSYLSLVVKAESGYADAEAWVWGVDDDFLLRCEDGRGEAIRSDPETYAGEEQIFLYYHVIGSGAAGFGDVSLYKCATGISP